MTQRSQSEHFIQQFGYIRFLTVAFQVVVQLTVTDPMTLCILKEIIKPVYLPLLALVSIQHCCVRPLKHLCWMSVQVFSILLLVLAGWQQSVRKHNDSVQQLWQAVSVSPHAWYCFPVITEALEAHVAAQQDLSALAAATYRAVMLTGVSLPS